MLISDIYLTGQIFPLIAAKNLYVGSSILLSFLETDGKAEVLSQPTPTHPTSVQTLTSSNPIRIKEIQSSFNTITTHLTPIIFRCILRQFLRRFVVFVNLSALGQNRTKPHKYRKFRGRYRGFGLVGLWVGRLGVGCLNGKSAVWTQALEQKRFRKI